MNGSGGSQKEATGKMMDNAALVVYDKKGSKLVKNSHITAGWRLLKITSTPPKNKQ